MQNHSTFSTCSSPFARALQGVALIAFLAVTASARAADTFDILTKQADTPTSTVWRVETPNVKQKQTDYPSSSSSLETQSASMLAVVSRREAAGSLGSAM